MPYQQSAFTQFAAVTTFVASLTLPFCLSAAPLTLTQAGIDAGFSLSTFATIDPGNTGCCGGPFGVAVTSSGNVIVQNVANATRYSFADIDNQTRTTALNTVAAEASTTAYASAGGQAYGSFGGRFVQFNSDGTVNHVLTGVNLAPYLGMWGNPLNGHILASASNGALIDIDPTAANGAGSYRTVLQTSLGDGVSVSPDGATVYYEQNDSINGYNILTGALVFSSGVLGNSPDGVGVISSSNALNGYLIINFNGNGVNTGQVGLMNPATKSLTIIANGGTRGDYVSPDVTNGTLLMDYSDSIYRLSCGPNCAIGSPMVGPEPATFVLVALPFAGILVTRFRRRKRTGGN